MKTSLKRAGLSAGILALIAAGACAKKSEPADESLKNDLALVSSASRPQVVVSALEAGETAKPAHAAPTRAPKPAPKAATPVARKQTPAPAPAPEPVQQAPVVEAPAPAPVRAEEPRQDRRVYKTEGEIFKQMPWIRP